MSTEVRDRVSVWRVSGRWHSILHAKKSVVQNFSACKYISKNITQLLPGNGKGVGLFTLTPVSSPPRF